MKTIAVWTLMIVAGKRYSGEDALLACSVDLPFGEVVVV